MKISVFNADSKAERSKLSNLLAMLWRLHEEEVGTVSVSRGGTSFQFLDGCGLDGWADAEGFILVDDKERRNVNHVVEKVVATTHAS